MAFSKFDLEIHGQGYIPKVWHNNRQLARQCHRTSKDVNHSSGFRDTQGLYKVWTLASAVVVPDFYPWARSYVQSWANYYDDYNSRSKQFHGPWDMHSVMLHTLHKFHISERRNCQLFYSNISNNLQRLLVLIGFNTTNMVNSLDIFCYIYHELIVSQCDASLLCWTYYGLHQLKETSQYPSQFSIALGEFLGCISSANINTL